MNETEVKRWFEDANLRIRFEEAPPRVNDRRESSLVSLRRSLPPTATFDVAEDRQGEHFVCTVQGDTILQFVEAVPEKKHLLLRDAITGRKLLFGHDERHLFVASAHSNSRTVVDALIRLAPKSIQEALRGTKKPGRKIWKRRTKRFIRQGEWFFLPSYNVQAPPEQVLRNEPIQRNDRAKPHICEEMYRYGGEDAYLVLHGTTTKTLTPGEYENLLVEARVTGEKVRVIRQARTGATVYVRGKISHADHSTIDLGQTWHRVELNLEQTSNSVRWLD